MIFALKALELYELLCPVDVVRVTFALSPAFHSVKYKGFHTIVAIRPWRCEMRKLQTHQFYNTLVCMWPLVCGIHAWRKEVLKYLTHVYNI